MPDVCSVDGVVEPSDRATIPALDRGFLFGDSVYEVFRTRRGVPFAWREHVERLIHSASGIGLHTLPEPRVLMRHVVDALAGARSGEVDDLEYYLRLIVTRGTASDFRLSPDAVQGPPRIVVFARGIRRSRSGELSRVALVPRATPAGRGHDPSVKSGNYVANMLGVAAAQRAGAPDCVFVAGDGSVTEASTANLYLVRGGSVYTPPLDAGILAGVTRRHLLEAARAGGMEVLETRLTADDVRSADEVFLSATLRDVAPVVEVDGRPVGDGAAGPVTRRLTTLWEDRVAQLVVSDRQALNDLLR